MKNIIGNRWYVFTRVFFLSSMLFLIMSTFVLVLVFFQGIYKRVYINREIQNNISSIINAIEEDIAENGIVWVSEDLLDKCSLNFSWSFKVWAKFCTSKNQYFIAKSISWDWVRVSDLSKDCSDETCFFVKKDDKWLIFPITDDNIKFDDLNFYVSKDYINKLTINFTMRVSSWWFISDDLSEDGGVVFQTTLSEKFISKK